MFNLFNLTTESQVGILHTDDTGMKVTENKQKVIPVIMPEFEPKDLSIVNKKDTSKNSNKERVLEISSFFSAIFLIYVALAIPKDIRV